MAEFLALLGALALSLAANELSETAPWLAARIVSWCSGRLPARDQERYRREHRANLEAIPGKVSKLVFALRLLLGLPAQQAAYLGIPTRTLLLQGVVQFYDRFLAWRLPSGYRQWLPVGAAPALLWLFAAGATRSGLDIPPWPVTAAIIGPFALLLIAILLNCVGRLVGLVLRLPDDKAGALTSGAWSLSRVGVGLWLAVSTTWTLGSLLFFHPPEQWAGYIGSSLPTMLLSLGLAFVLQSCAGWHVPEHHPSWQTRQSRGVRIVTTAGAAVLLGFVVWTLLYSLVRVAWAA